jgi:sigma-B regulation protein RsbU (phosphoserine phosphatase)
LDYKSLYKLRTQPKGISLEYKILRENQVFVKKVTLATFGIPISLLIYFIIGILFIFVGWIYSYNNPQYIGSKLTGIWLIMMGFSFGTQMQMIPLEFKIYGIAFALFKETVSIGALGIIMHSFSYFPTENKEIIRRKWIHVLIYSVFLVQLLFIYASYFGLFHLFSTTTFIYITIGLIVFYVICRLIFRKASEKKYQRINIIVISMFASIIVFGNLPNIIPLKDYTFLTILWYLTTFLTFLIPVLYLLIAWKYRIYDISFKLRKNLQYNMLTILWQLVMFGCGIATIWFLTKLDFSNFRFKVIGSNIEFFSHNGISESDTGFEKILFLVISIIIIFIVYKFAFTIQKILNEKFYRSKFDYKKSQKELIKLIQTNFTLRDLARIIVEKLSVLVHLKRVSTIFYKKKTSSGEAIYCFDSSVGNDFCYLLEPGHHDIISQYDTIVGIDRLPEKIRENIDKKGIKYIIPIKSKGELIGTIFIGEKLSETAMTSDDFDFIHSVTSHISVAIENALLYEDLAEQERMRHELEIARNIQLSSLPQSLPHISGLDVSGISIPAHEVGGDFYDFYNGNGNDLTVVVGDVSGKGTSAALYMSKVQGIMRTLNEFDLSPRDLFVRTNRLLYKNIESNSFITAIGAHFDFGKREILLSRAGHLPLIKYSAKTGQIEYLLTSGIGLGLANEDIFTNAIEEIRYSFEKGDVFLFLSDGLTDARNTKMEEFGLERLADIVIDNSDKSSKNLCDEIIREVNEYAGETGQFDDITAVVVKVTQ